MHVQMRNNNLRSYRVGQFVTKLLPKLILCIRFLRITIFGPVTPLNFLLELIKFNVCPKSIQIDTHHILSQWDTALLTLTHSNCPIFILYNPIYYMINWTKREKNETCHEIDCIRYNMSNYLNGYT